MAPSPLTSAPCEAASRAPKADADSRAGGPAKRTSTRGCTARLVRVGVRVRVRVRARARVRVRVRVRVSTARLCCRWRMATAAEMPHALSTPMPKQRKATVTRSLFSLAPPEDDEPGGAAGGQRAAARRRRGWRLEGSGGGSGGRSITLSETLPRAAKSWYSPIASVAVKRDELSRIWNSARLERGTTASVSPGPTAQPLTLTVVALFLKNVAGATTTPSARTLSVAVQSSPLANNKLATSSQRWAIVRRMWANLGANVTDRQTSYPKANTD
eukprot:scaffold132122_cov60-Phaeocystis_antarctica.AAC.2